MEPSSPLWNAINRFLDNHTFDLEWSFPDAEGIKFKTKFKMKLTGMRVYRQSKHSFSTLLINSCVQSSLLVKLEDRTSLIVGYK
jgi:hypothetical protein